MDDRGTQRALSMAKIGDVTNAVRAFCVIYHTSLMYHTNHDVFRSAVEERMSAIETAIQGLPALSLTFAEGQIRCAGLPLEPGSGVFQRVAQAFEKIGIRNLTLLPGIDADEITRLIALIGTQADRILGEGLPAVLKRERFRWVRSREPEHRIGEADASGEAGPASSPVAPSEHGGSAGKAWDISDDSAASEVAMDDAETSTPAPEIGRPPRSFRMFIAGVLGALARNEADPNAVAELISTEFEHRVEERVGTIRRESEKKIRRLETVKELVLAELERLSIAAVIMDSAMQILAMNRLAGDLLGDIQNVEPGSPIEQFVRSGQEKMAVEIGGRQRTAHLVTVSPSGGGTDIMLFTLEKV